MILTDRKPAARGVQRHRVATFFALSFGISWGSPAFSPLNVLLTRIIAILVVVRFGRGWLGMHGTPPTTPASPRDCSADSVR